MFEGASHLIFQNAAQLRKKMTAAENVLWLHLREGVCGCKFRRQHPMGIYIADFYCHKGKLIVEIDGSIHHQPEIKENDEIREKALIAMGYQVIRFTNKQVMHEIEMVIEIIKKKLQ